MNSGRIDSIKSEGISVRAKISLASRLGCHALSNRAGSLMAKAGCFVAVANETVRDDESVYLKFFGRLMLQSFQLLENVVPGQTVIQVK